MSMYRGPGGAGDATGDASNQALIAVQAAEAAAQSAADALGYRDDAQTAAQAAIDAVADAETILGTSVADAEAAALAAQTAQGLAEAAATEAQDIADGISTDLSAYATKTGAETLTNKTLTAPTINGGSVNNAPIGATTPSTGAFSSLTVGGVAVVTTTGTQTLTNKTLTTPTIASINNGGTVTLPSGTHTLVSRTTTDTLTNKTLTSPVISTIVNTGTLTLPTSTDTLVGRATTDTLTNKTLTSPAINGGNINNAVIGGTTPAAGTFTTLRGNSLCKVRADSPTVGSAANATVVDITGWTERNDPQNAFNAATGVFTAPRAGTYLICAQVGFDSGSWGAGNNGSVVISKNGTIVGQAFQIANAAGTYAFFTGTFSQVFELAASDTIKIQVYQNSGSAKTVNAATNTIVSIAELP